MSHSSTRYDMAAKGKGCHTQWPERTVHAVGSGVAGLPLLAGLAGRAARAECARCADVARRSDLARLPSLARRATGSGHLESDIGQTPPKTQHCASMTNLNSWSRWENMHLHLHLLLANGCLQGIELQVERWSELRGARGRANQGRGWQGQVSGETAGRGPEAQMNATSFDIVSWPWRSSLYSATVISPTGMSDCEASASL